MPSCSALMRVAHPNKDYDLDLFIIKKSEKNILERRHEVKKIIFNSGVTTDVLVYTRDQLKNSKILTTLLSGRRLLIMVKFYMSNPQDKDLLIGEWLARADERWPRMHMVYGAENQGIRSG